MWIKCFCQSSLAVLERVISRLFLVTLKGFYYFSFYSLSVGILSIMLSDIYKSNLSLSLAKTTTQHCWHCNQFRSCRLRRSIGTIPKLFVPFSHWDPKVCTVKEGPGIKIPQPPFNITRKSLFSVFLYCLLQPEKWPSSTPLMAHCTDEHLGEWQHENGKHDRDNTLDDFLEIMVRIPVP